ncbi:FadR/GntR family transcriptional regulator [Embleya sp. AB8]|uniref:FadR/GntR family transcriptional regulator n=1 Tax=Embleya sp. AB8 TaxID=3156304 RepID=UPI003C7415EA
MTVRAVRRTSLVEQAVTELRRLVEGGEWPVGSRLPGEVELSRLLGVGRSTSREAVRALIAAGQLHSRQGLGTFVASIAPVTDFDRQLRRAELAHIYEVRVALEVEAGRLAALRRTRADISALRDALAAREQARGAAELVDVDLEFHRAVVTAAHNPVLTDLFATFLDAVRDASTEMVADQGPSPEDHKHDAHAALVQAIEDSDPQAAMAATRHNVEHTLAQLRPERP